jgi:hypothetical protein
LKGSERFVRNLCSRLYKVVGGQINGQIKTPVCDVEDQKTFISG